MYIPFGKSLTGRFSASAIVIGLMGSPLSYGQPYGDLAEQIRDHAQTNQFPASRTSFPDLDSFRSQVDSGAAKKYGELAQILAREGVDRLAMEGGEGSEEFGQCTSPMTVVAVSRSLGKTALEEIFSTAAGGDNITVVFRGVAEGQTIGDGILQMQSWLKDLEPMPTVQITPPIFRDHNIKFVPETLRFGPGQWSEEGCKRPVVARVRGVSDPAFLLRRVEAGDRGDLGVRGDVQPIAEPDLIEVMQAKMATIDWEQKRAQAQSRMWHNLPTLYLPEATSTGVYHVDPTVIATRDIEDGEGNVIIPKGAQANPLELRTWTQKVIVFDPLSERQVQMALSLAQDARDQGLRPVPLVTQYAPEKGAEFLNELMRLFNSPVFLLSPEVRDRFQLQSVPSAVTANSTHFIVTEYSPGDWEGT